MEITDSIQIKATPKRVFNFLPGLKDNESYRAMKARERKGKDK